MEGIVTKFEGWVPNDLFWGLLRTSVDQGVHVPVHFIFQIDLPQSLHLQTPAQNLIVTNSVENSNQLICQVREISAENPHSQLGFRVTSTPIAQFMQILKYMLKCNHTRSSIPHWLFWPPRKSLNKKCFPINNWQFSL